MRIPESILIARDVLVWVNFLRKDLGWLDMVRNLIFWLKAHVCMKEEYWLFESDTIEVLRHSCLDMHPRVPVRFIMLHSNEEADRLERSGLRFQHFNPRSRRALQVGTWCCVMVVDGVVASVAWTVMNEEQRKVLGEAPYKTLWDKGEGQSTNVYTMKQYRKLHLRTSSVWVRSYWLHIHGFTIRRSAIHKSNLASLAGVALYPGIRIVGEATHIRVLGKSIWKESRFGMGNSAIERKAGCEAVACKVHL